MAQQECPCKEIFLSIVAAAVFIGVYAMSEKDKQEQNAILYFAVILTSAIALSRVTAGILVKFPQYRKKVAITATVLSVLAMFVIYFGTDTSDIGYSKTKLSSLKIMRTSPYNMFLETIIIASSIISMEALMHLKLPNTRELADMAVPKDSKK